MNSENKPLPFEVGKCYKLIGSNNWVTYSNDKCLDKCLYGDGSGIFIKKNDSILILSQFHEHEFDGDKTFISFFYKGDLLYTFIYWDEFDKFEEIQ